MTTKRTSIAVYQPVLAKVKKLRKQFGLETTDLIDISLDLFRDLDAEQRAEQVAKHTQQRIRRAARS